MMPPDSGSEFDEQLGRSLRDLKDLNPKAKTGQVSMVKVLSNL